ncbi:helicase SRCAP-like [Cataglyphis hispanica]|uniref:helicase SRCAP-like n=1 Tax=Cataglyphis hispanica TaxID=1086592 RepID=UPI0021804CC9|nr:helicase SRCAP-like [Cataglyphis hispanica]
MSRILLFLTLICTYALASVPEDAKQKRGIIGNNGWIGVPGPYGHGHPWSVDHTPWKGLKLQAGLHSADALSTYRDSIALTPGILRAPVYVTKHVVLEKPVPVPEPVIIEKPYHVPVSIEKIIHKPVPVPVPVPKAVPIPVEHPVPIPVKQPIAVPVHQPYPVPVKHPVPVPIRIHPISPPLPLISVGGLPGGTYVRDCAPGHLYASPYHPPSNALHLDHGIATFPHGFGHGLSHVLAHGHEYDHSHAHVHAHADHLVHEHDHKKRKADKN